MDTIASTGILSIAALVTLLLPTLFTYRWGNKFRIDNGVPVGYFLIACLFLAPIVLLPMTIYGSLLMYMSGAHSPLHKALSFLSPLLYAFCLIAGYVWSFKLYRKKQSYLSLWPSLLSGLTIPGYLLLLSWVGHTAH